MTTIYTLLTIFIIVVICVVIGEGVGSFISKFFKK